MRKTWTIAELTVRDVLRRRGVIVLMLLLPTAFYLLRHNDSPGQSVRLLCLGLSWGVSTAGLFVAASARAVEPRLRLSGYATAQLYLGRLCALWTLGFALLVPFAVVVRFDHPWMRPAGIVLAMAFCVLIGAPLGLLIGGLLPRELEGMLLLLIVCALQMMVNPDDLLMEMLPLWSSREIGIWAVDEPDDLGYLLRGVAAGVAWTIALVGLVGGVSAVRLRRRAHVRAL
ncbi:hypothetical protein Val02_24840 [Virgisporangium aliadipatigenens]|uniref:Uncharacterized protein n=1 Tax=Virgisporangium aliadipatigenens TaxID=741659 RepID=A0A8J4DQE0_9ACTN|nr:hypothetical protein [Virgisporangium aliadipatigenens]GIJ45598.1 hypothetical protein Val02_24840 [Virgisporangium aliadipatigenens]